MKSKLSLSVIILFFGISSCQKVGSSALDSATVATTNDIDNLNIAYEGMTNVGDSRTYTYTNSGPDSQLSIGAYLDQGSVDVKIKDNSGSVIYDKSFSSIAADVSMLSNSTTSWTVEVDLSNASGEFALTLLKEE